MIKFIAEVEIIPLLQIVADCAAQTLKELKYDDVLIDLSFFEEDAMLRLNNESRGVDKSTDVLSFPSLEIGKKLKKKNYPFDFDEFENAIAIGQIVLCIDVIKRQAEEFGHSFERECAYMLTHGILHLLGYDHEETKDKVKMRQREEKILALAGIENIFKKGNN